MSDPSKDNALSRIYREGSWPEPSRQIDQAILAASRRAAREQHSFVRRWAPSFAVAATVVLTSTLVLKAYREQPEVVSPSVSDDQPAARAKQAPPAAEARSAAAPPPAPQPVTPRGYTSTMDSGEAERLDRLQRDLGLKQSLPASESPRPAPRSALAEKSALALKKEASDAARESQKQQPANATVSVFGAPAPAQQPLRALAKPALPATRPEPRAAPVPTPISAEAPASPPSAAADTDPISANALSAAVAGRTTSKAPERSPQTWIEDIRKLVAEGKLEQADRELVDFEKRYPDFIVPQDLR